MASLGTHLTCVYRCRVGLLIAFSKGASKGFWMSGIHHNTLDCSHPRTEGVNNLRNGHCSKVGLYKF